MVEFSSKMVPDGVRPTTEATTAENRQFHVDSAAPFYSFRFLSKEASPQIYTFLSQQNNLEFGYSFLLLRRFEYYL